MGKNSYLYIVAVACYKKQSWVIEGPRSETDVSRTFMSSIYKHGSRIPRFWSWWKKTFLTRVVVDWFTIQWRSSNCMLVLFFFGFTLFFQRVFMCTVMSNIFLSIENRIHRMCDQRWNRNQIHVAYLIIFFLILDANYINRRSIIGFVSIQRRFTWNHDIFIKITLFLINPKIPPPESKNIKLHPNYIYSLNFLN